MIDEREFIAFINSIKNPHLKKYNVFSAYIKMFKKYAQFNGRSQRSEYWWAILAHHTIVIILEVISAVLINANQTARNSTIEVFIFVTVILLIVYVLATLIPVIALSVRRLHDTGKKGWFMLLSIIPYGFFILFLFLITDSELGILNKYGKNPKGIKYFHLPEGYIEALKNYSKQFIPGDLDDFRTHEKMIYIISKIAPVITLETMTNEIKSTLKTKTGMTSTELAINIAYAVNLLIAPQYAGKFFLNWKKLSDEDLMSAFICLDVWIFCFGENECKNLKFVHTLIALVLINRGVRFVSIRTKDTEPPKSSNMSIYL